MMRRARLYDLAARADAQRLAGLARDLGALRAEHSAAAALDARLHDLIDHLAPVTGPQTAAMLRNTGALIGQITQEAVNHRDRAAAAHAQMQTVQAQIASHDQRRRLYLDAARTARLAEAEAAQSRAEAAAPPRANPPR